MGTTAADRADDDGEPVRVTLLHGMGGRAAVWDRLARRLLGPIELWDVELPWCTLGDPAWSRGGDPAGIVTEAAGTAEVLVAHSFSANLVLEELAAGHLAPRPVVLVSPFFRASPDDFGWSTITYYLDGFHRTFAEALRLDDTGRYPEAQREWMARKLRDAVGPYGWMRFFDTYLRTPFLELGVVRSPVLVVTGTDDIAAPPSDGRALAGGLPDGSFLPLEGCGHFPMLERPGDLAAALAGFVRDAFPRRSGARHIDHDRSTTKELT